MALFFGAQLLFSGITSALLGGFDGGNALDPERLVLISLPVGLLASYLVGGLAVVWLLARRHRLTVRTALALEPYAPLRLAGPFLAGFALQFAVSLTVVFVPPPAEQNFLFDIFLRGGPWALAFFFGVAVFLAPAMEEVLFRGLLLPALMQRWGFHIAALGVTGLFTALHTFQTGFYWPALLGIFLCGWVLAELRVTRRSLWPAVAFHMGFNFTAFLPLLFLQSLGP